MYTYRARYIDTVDGDTVDIIVDLGFKAFLEIRIRLTIVDTPERGESGWQEATDFTRRWFESNPVFLITTSRDITNDKVNPTAGWGRWLGTCTSLNNGENISELLLKNNLAIVYKRK